MRKKILNLLGVFTLMFSVLFSSVSSIAEAVTNGVQRQAHITTHKPIDDNSTFPGYKPGNGLVWHFTVDDSIGKAYCYDWNKTEPDKIDQVFNQYDFWNGMGQAVGANKASQVAAAMMQGYHLNQDKGQWEVGESFKGIAQAGYNEFLANQYTPANYSFDAFAQDVTQAVIWRLDGKPVTDEPTVQHLLENSFGQALYDYAIAHPLDQQTAEAKNILVKSNGKEVNASNPLTIDSKTLQSNAFEIEGYNGAVYVGDSTGNIQIIDAATNNPVQYITAGNSYYLKANTYGNSGDLQLNYQKVSESHYFEPTTLDGNSQKYQNLVNLATQTSNLPVKYVFGAKDSSSTSSDATNSESTTSSVDTASSTTNSDSSSTSSDATNSESTTSSVDTASSTTNSDSSSTSSDATNSESTTSSSEKHAVVISKQGNNSTNDKSNGENGSNGSAGANGVNGSNGEAGSNGSAGTNGVNGSNGSNGSNGEAGSNGSGITKFLGSLPQTGNKKSVVLTVIGLVLVVAVVAIVVVKRKSKK